jgi:hypothetical protein
MNRPEVMAFICRNDSDLRANLKKVKVMSTSTAFRGVRSSNAQSLTVGACGGHNPQRSHPKKEHPELCAEGSMSMSAHHSTTGECDLEISQATEQNRSTITSLCLEKVLPISMVRFLF